MSPVRIVAHPVADGTVSLTDARTVCHATRYMAHTARMVEQPIGVRTRTAINITAIPKFHQNVARRAGKIDCAASTS